MRDQRIDSVSKMACESQQGGSQPASRADSRRRQYQHRHANTPNQRFHQPSRLGVRRHGGHDGDGGQTGTLWLQFRMQQYRGPMFEERLVK